MVSIRRSENGLAATSPAWLGLALAIASTSAKPILEGEIPDVVSYKAGAVAYKPGYDGRGPIGDSDKSIASELSEGRTAWGAVPFEFPNVADNWVNPSDSAWSWDVTLKGDMGAMVALPWPDKSRMLYFTAGKLGLQMPTTADNKTTPVDPEWNLCLVRWDLGNQRYNDKLRADDGTCSSVLSDQCARAIEDRVERDFTRTRTCGCATAAEIPECAGDDAAAAWDSGCSAVPFGAAEMAAWEGGRHELLTFISGGFVEARNTTVYNDLGSVAWPVLAVLSGGSLDDGVAYGRSRLACVRATESAPGWELPSLTAKNTTKAGHWEGESDNKADDDEADNNKTDDGKTDGGKDSGAVKTNAASGASFGTLGAAVLGVGGLISALLI